MSVEDLAHLMYLCTLQETFNILYVSVFVISVFLWLATMYRYTRKRQSGIIDGELILRALVELLTVSSRFTLGKEAHYFE